MEDRHPRARGFLVELDGPEVGRHTVPGLSWHLSDTPGRVERHAPLLGEHVRYVLGELLGLAQDQQDRLVESEVIS